MSGSKNINNYCYITKPIYISPEDVLSDSTITQLLNHNEKWQAICEERRIKTVNVVGIVSVANIPAKIIKTNVYVI